MPGPSSATLRCHARLEPAVAISPLSCHESNLAADGAGAPADAPSLSTVLNLARSLPPAGWQYRRRTVAPPFIEPGLCGDGCGHHRLQLCDVRC
jgi:hypothetical protein